MCLKRVSLIDSNLRLQILSWPALRLYPPVPVNARTALCTTILPTGGGPDRTSPILIPKGSSVAYSVYNIASTARSIWYGCRPLPPRKMGRANAPEPQRDNSKWGYLPFNGGSRICLGSEYLKLLWPSLVMDVDSYELL